MTTPRVHIPLAASAIQPVQEQAVKTLPDGTYSQILTSSALIGGSSILNIAIGVIRTKAFATLLGPAGFGLFGLYNSVADLAQNIAGMGVNSSGVRQIAEAMGSGDTARVARTAAVLRRTSVVLGVIGALLLILFSRQVSQLTFGTTARAAGVAALSLAVLLRLIAAGQAALIQGTRRIAELAQIAVWGGSLGAVISVALVYVFREKGIVPSLVIAAAITVCISHWYSRRVAVGELRITPSEVSHEARTLLRLGVAFMASSFLTMGVGYWIRITIMHRAGMEAAGLYQSAWTLGGLYVGLILQAMAADFYPRLTAVANDNTECNRLVNEQALVGLLLAGPGVLATLTFAPVVIALFYSTKFGAAVGVLRWICLGTTLQVMTWPLGFITMAKGRQGWFFFSELSWAVVATCLTWLCVRAFGLIGAGMAFFGSYVFHLFLTYPIARHLTSFHWSRRSARTGLFFLLLIAAVFCSFQVIPFRPAIALGTLATLLASAYSIRTLLRLVPQQSLPGPVRRLISVLRLRPSA